jgi:anti-sigma factor RsiW
MTNDPIYNHLRELSWRRKLSPAEEAELRTWLAAHPEAEADWEAEAGLNAVLGRLPDAPVPSNFTARVLQAVEREAIADLRRSRGNWLILLRQRWMPRVAFAAVVVGAGLLSYHQVQAAHRKKLAESVATISAVSSLPSPEILRDFDAISALNPTPAPDEQLLMVLQ